MDHHGFVCEVPLVELTFMFIRDLRIQSEERWEKVGSIGGRFSWFGDERGHFGRMHQVGSAVIEEDDILGRCGQVNGNIHDSARPED